jgi:hypothetical protein
MAKKKKKGKGKKKLSKQLTKQLRKVIKVHGTELALGFVTGIITKLIADKTGKSDKAKKSKNVAKTDQEEQSPLITAVKETTQAVANKVKTAIVPAKPAARKAPARRVNPKPVITPELAPEITPEPA